MEYLILGLLILSPRTIYDLRERVNQGLNLMYSSSTGSIQAALKKLLSSGHIVSREQQENGRLKKIYSVTPEGRAHFSHWVELPMGAGTAKNPELVKLYFMGLSDPAHRRENLRRCIQSLQQPYEILCAVCREAESMEVPPDTRDILYFQAACARYGRDFYQFQIDWYRRLLEEITNQEESEL